MTTPYARDLDSQPVNMADMFRGLLRKWYFWVAVVCVLGLIFMMTVVASFVGTRNGLIDRETQLSARYQDDQNVLSAFVLTVHDQFNIAEAKAGKLDKILTDAMRGRYDKALTAATPGQGAQTSFISALREAYPNLGGLDSYDRIMDTVAAGRADFRKNQSVLLDQIRNYENYRSKGFLKPVKVAMIGYPRLEARIGRQVVHGKAALTQMKLIVTDAETNRDFTTGQQGSINLHTDNG